MINNAPKLLFKFIMHLKLIVICFVMNL